MHFGGEVVTMSHTIRRHNVRRVLQMPQVEGIGTMRSSHALATIDGAKNQALTVQANCADYMRRGVVVAHGLHADLRDASCPPATVVQNKAGKTDIKETLPHYV